MSTISHERTDRWSGTPLTQRTEHDYSDDEIEEILGITAPETKLVLRQVRETVMESPLLALGLAFTFGILVGLGLNQTRKRV